MRKTDEALYFSIINFHRSFASELFNPIHNGDKPVVITNLRWHIISFGFQNSLSFVFQLDVLEDEWEDIMRCGLCLILPFYNKGIV